MVATGATAIAAWHNAVAGAVLVHSHGGNLVQLVGLPVSGHQLNILHHLRGRGVLLSVQQWEGGRGGEEWVFR